MTDAAPGFAPRIVRMETRFLWCFTFDPAKVDPATALASVGIAGKERAWTAPAEPPQKYVEEMPRRIAEFLFGREGGCSYWHLDAALAMRLFEKKELRRGSLRMPVEGAGQGVEVWLTREGVGVLSVTLSPGDADLSLPRAVEWQYRLAQVRESTTADLRRTHPSDDPRAWAAIPPASRERVAPPLPPGSPLDARLFSPGGSFRLPELVALLLLPLSPQSVHDGFSVYTVVRLDESADLGLPGVLPALSPFLSALAQSEEPGHAGALPGDVPAVHGVLNRRHATAATLLGAAHVVSDQPSGHPYNPQRLSRVRDKYFVLHLAAMLQQQTLSDLLRRASRALLGPAEALSVALSDARRSLLRFGVFGRAEVASQREALQRAYELSVDALRVREAWEEARRSIGEVGDELAHRAAEQQQQAQKEILEAQREELGESKQSLDRLVTLQKELVHLQHQVHLIEVFLVTVYSAHLAEMIWHDPDGHGIAWHVLVAGAAGFLVSWWFIVVRAKRKRERAGAHDQS